MTLRIAGAATLSLLVSMAAEATAPGSAPACEDILKKFGKELADVKCFASTDLTTNGSQTTPANDSIAGLPPFAFTPVTDRGVIAPSAGKRPPITKVVPGLQIEARIASDPTGQARFLLRLPNDWNGRLVVAGASGTRSEFNGDFAWSDYVVQKGYAYASQNKGVLNLQLSTAADPLACRLNPSSPVYVNFYDNGPGQEFGRWAQYMVKAGELAQDGVHAAYDKPAKYTYAVGTSNGGYQVRRAVELAPKVFDGGVDWEGTDVSEEAPNLLADLPPAVLNFPDYVASGFNANSTAAKNLITAGYPPDIVLPIVPPATAPPSFWLNHSNAFWEVTACQWQKRLDPAYNTYVDGIGNYSYTQRRSFSNVGANMGGIATTGDVQRPLITIAGTMDALLPIDHHARAYARKVGALRTDQKSGQAKEDAKKRTYRLYEVQNGNHIETYQDTFTQLELIMPHAQKAFDLLVQQVEDKVTLPPSQCIPRGGGISVSPAQPGHCAQLFVP